MDQMSRRGEIGLTRAVKAVPFLVLALALGSVLCLPARQAHAFGMGLYGSAGTGDVEVDDQDFGGTLDLESMTMFEGGLVVDTNLSEDDEWNWRIKVGVETGFNDDYDFLGGVLDNTLGWGFVRTPDYRFWVGTTLRMSGQEVHGPDDWSQSSSVFAIGPAVGGNWNVGRLVTLGLEAGYLKSLSSDFDQDKLYVALMMLLRFENITGETDTFF
jgi:hypothetical protein